MDELLEARVVEILRRWPLDRGAVTGPELCTGRVPERIRLEHGENVGRSPKYILPAASANLKHEMPSDICECEVFHPVSGPGCGETTPGLKRPLCRASPWKAPIHILTPVKGTARDSRSRSLSPRVKKGSSSSARACAPTTAFISAKAETRAIPPANKQSPEPSLIAYLKLSLTRLVTPLIHPELQDSHTTGSFSSSLFFEYCLDVPVSEEYLTSCPAVLGSQSFSQSSQICSPPSPPLRSPPLPTASLAQKAHRLAITTT